MKIVADEDIPWLKEYFGQYGELVLKPGRSLCRKDILDADILLVRSVINVNRELLQNTNVKFIGTATIGIDHLDTQWLDEHGILWSSARGCNADAVAEYVISVLAALQQEGYLPAEHLRVAVIGVGQIGSQVAAQLQALGYIVWQCDPLRAQAEPNFPHTPLEQLPEVDFVTLHTPLTHGGQYATYHFIEKHFLQKQKPQTVLLNTARGSVIDFADLKQYGKHLHWCLDVWEHEPNIDLTVMQQALIATPHIAGYSLQSKHRATAMLYQAAVEKKIISSQILPNIALPVLTLTHPASDWRDLVLSIYDPRVTSQHMKQALMTDPHSFDQVRKSFQDRYEFAYVNSSPS